MERRPFQFFGPTRSMELRHLAERPGRSFSITPGWRRNAKKSCWRAWPQELHVVGRPAAEGTKVRLTYVPDFHIDTLKPISRYFRR